MPGGHLERSVNLQEPVAWATPDSLGRDEAFIDGWLKGKKHRITGEPLEILYVDLPPGSMVSAAAHMPHGVEPREEGRGTRLCTLFACVPTSTSSPFARPMCKPQLTDWLGL